MAPPWRSSRRARFACGRRAALPTTPELPQAQEADPPGIFAAADALEFRKHDYAGAIAALREPARSANASVRAAALVRIARNYLGSGQLQEARKTYAQLSSLGSLPIGGMPAALAGGIGALAVFERENNRAGLSETARAVLGDLRSGRWAVTSATYHYIVQEASRWTPKSSRGAVAKLELAEALERLWQRWRDGATQSGGRASLETSTGPVLIVWRSSGSMLTAFAATREALKKQLPAPDGGRLALTDPDGHYAIGGPAQPGVRSAIRLSSVTQLPWNVQVFAASDTAETAAFRSRRRLLIAGMAILLLMIGTGGWFIGHTVARELAVAQMQSDFVSAISHEFRTPLTTLFQLSELLKRGRVASEQDRQEYYELLHSESDRLRRLVEGLLNFGRLEAGRMQFRFEKVDIAELVRQSAAEFAQGQQACGHRLDVETDTAPPLVQADREALRCVLWNLFDNAVKYSPDCETVRVAIAGNGRQVEIAVRDQGIGIPPNEQRRIFDKFVRGSAARASNIRGTGIGLATARQIVRAHGGDISVESQSGQGSTFRVLLPVNEI